MIWPEFPPWRRKGAVRILAPQPVSVLPGEPVHTVEALFTAPLTVTAILSGLKAAKRKLTGREYKQLVSAAIAELLAQHPNISIAEARILAAEATGIPPTPELLRAKTMLKQTNAYAQTHKTVPYSKSSMLATRVDKMKAGGHVMVVRAKVSGRRVVKRKAAKRGGIHPRKKK